eukprot:g56517.t1
MGSKPSRRKQPSVVSRFWQASSQYTTILQRPHLFFFPGSFSTMRTTHSSQSSGTEIRDIDIPISGIPGHDRLRWSKVPNLVSVKLFPMWQGPYTVLEQVDSYSGPIAFCLIRGSVARCEDFKKNGRSRLPGDG